MTKNENKSASKDSQQKPPTKTPVIRMENSSPKTGKGALKRAQKKLIAEYEAALRVLRDTHPTPSSAVKAMASHPFIAERTSHQAVELILTAIEHPKTDPTVASGLHASAIAWLAILQSIDADPDPNSDDNTKLKEQLAKDLDGFFPPEDAIMAAVTPPPLVFRQLSNIFVQGINYDEKTMRFSQGMGWWQPVHNPLWAEFSMFWTKFLQHYDIQSGAFRFCYLGLPVGEQALPEGEEGVATADLAFPVE